jgi:hypothetical protein
MKSPPGCTSTSIHTSRQAVEEIRSQTTSHPEPSPARVAWPGRAHAYACSLNLGLAAVKHEASTRVDYSIQTHHEAVRRSPRVHGVSLRGDYPSSHHRAKPSTSNILRRPWTNTPVVQLSNPSSKSTQQSHDWGAESMDLHWRAGQGKLQQRPRTYPSNPCTVTMTLNTCTN